MEAILRTGAQRMRPVLLTTTTTILGLMPMVFGVNIDFVTREVFMGAPSSQWWTQLSTAIAFGLGFATILTLFVTPASLMIRANVQGWRARRQQAKLSSSAGQKLSPAE
jgi:multidrug efflux pump